MSLLQEFKVVLGQIDRRTVDNRFKMEVQANVDVKKVNQIMQGRLYLRGCVYYGTDSTEELVLIFG